MNHNKLCYNLEWLEQLNQVNFRNFITQVTNMDNFESSFIFSYTWVAFMDERITKNDFFELLFFFFPESKHWFLEVIGEYFTFVLQISCCVPPKPSPYCFPLLLIVSWTQATFLYTWKMILIPIIKDISLITKKL